MTIFTYRIEERIMIMDNKTKRIELHCHSCYSKMDGVSTVKDIIGINFAVQKKLANKRPTELP